MDHERGIPSKHKSSSCADYVPALCTHRPSLLPIEWSGELSGHLVLLKWKLSKPYHLEEGKVVTRFRIKVLIYLVHLTEAFAACNGYVTTTRNKELPLNARSVILVLSFDLFKLRETRKVLATNLYCESIRGPRVTTLGMVKTLRMIEPSSWNRQSAAKLRTSIQYSGEGSETVRKGVFTQVDA